MELNAPSCAVAAVRRTVDAVRGARSVVTPTPRARVGACVRSANHAALCVQSVDAWLQEANLEALEAMARSIDAELLR